MLFGYFSIFFSFLYFLGWIANFSSHLHEICLDNRFSAFYFSEINTQKYAFFTLCLKFSLYILICIIYFSIKIHLTDIVDYFLYWIILKFMEVFLVIILLLNFNSIIWIYYMNVHIQIIYFVISALWYLLWLTLCANL